MSTGLVYWPPGYQPYHATRHQYQWYSAWGDSKEPDAPKPGDLVITTMGSMSRVIDVSGWDPVVQVYRRVGPGARDCGWYTEAGWTSCTVRRPTEAELAHWVLQATGGAL